MKPVIAILFTLAAISSLSALDWPSESGRLQSNFGQNLSGRAATGLIFAGEYPVQAAGAGEVIFSTLPQTAPGSLPSPLGSWVAVDHGDGIMTIYGRLDFPHDSFSRVHLEKGQLLAPSGTSGWSTGRNFFFSVFDRNERRWVNPAMLAPPRVDTKPPVIRSVYLAKADGSRLSLGQTAFVRQGSYRLLVDAADNEDAAPGTLLAPQRISCTVNGHEQGAIYLDTLKTENGELLVSRGTSSSPVRYPADGPYPLGEIRLSRGKTSIVVLAKDAAGNERTVSYGIMVE